MTTGALRDGSMCVDVHWSVDKVGSPIVTTRLEPILLPRPGDLIDMTGLHPKQTTHKVLNVCLHPKGLALSHSTPFYTIVVTPFVRTAGRPDVPQGYTDAPVPLEGQPGRIRRATRAVYDVVEEAVRQLERR